MAPTRANLKRKASEAGAVAPAQPVVDDDDLIDGLLEGVLEGDEDSEDEASDSDDLADDDDELDGAAFAAEDDLASDDIPTDDEDLREKTAVTNGTDVDMDDGPNFRIEKDANGGDRYVYDEIDPVYDSDDTDAQEPVNTVRARPTRARFSFVRLSQPEIL